MNQYLLLLHETPGDCSSLSSAQMHEEVARYGAWAGELAQKGLLGAATVDRGRRRR